MTRPAAALLLLLAPLSASAETAAPMLISHEGRLLDGNDTPASGSRTLTFALFDTDNPNEKTALWTEANEVSFSSAGGYGLVLGKKTPLSDEILSHAALFISVAVNQSELLPRQRLVPVPFALRSNVANRAAVADTIAAGGVDTAALADGAVTLAKLARTSGKMVGLDADTVDGLDGAALASKTSLDDGLAGVRSELASTTSSVRADLTTGLAGVRTDLTALGDDVYRRADAAATFVKKTDPLDAAKLGGKTPDAFLLKSDTLDAAKLGGQPASAYVTGDSTTFLKNTQLPAAENLLRNADFADGYTGKAMGWPQTYNGVYGNTVYWEDAPTGTGMAGKVLRFDPKVLQNWVTSTVKYSSSLYNDDTTVTLSFYARQTGGSEGVKLFLDVCGQGGCTQERQTATSDGKWRRYAMSVPLKNVTDAAYKDLKEFSPYIGTDSAVSGAMVWIARVKLEASPFATPFVTHPRDQHDDEYVGALHMISGALAPTNGNVGISGAEVTSCVPTRVSPWARAAYVHVLVYGSDQGIMPSDKNGSYPTTNRDYNGISNYNTTWIGAYMTVPFYDLVGKCYKVKQYRADGTGFYLGLAGYYE